MTFHRTALTWQSYLTIGYYSYLLNVLGPITPFLRAEMNLSYTVTGFHYSAYALGIIVTSLLLNRVVARLGARVMVWVGVFGMAGGTLLFILGRHPALTVFGAFCMGLLGVLIAALLNASLAEQHGELRAIALAESTSIAAVFSTAAPLAVGALARTPLTFRAAPVLMLLAIPLLWIAFHRNAVGLQPAPQVSAAREKKRPLPAIYWQYWLLVFLAVAVEFCLLFWASTYLETVTGLSKVDAALGLSVFLAAMVVGRLMVSRLLRRSKEFGILMTSIAAATAGFLLFWLSSGAAAALAGLVLAGLGVAGMFPIINSLLLASVPDRMVEGSGRSTLAVGLAVLLLPMLLAQLADRFDIRSAYTVVLVLLLATAALALTIRARQAQKA